MVHAAEGDGALVGLAPLDRHLRARRRRTLLPARDLRRLGARRRHGHRLSGAAAGPEGDRGEGEEEQGGKAEGHEREAGKVPQTGGACHLFERIAQRKVAAAAIIM